MGWGTDFKIDIYLNRQIYKNREEVEYKIEEEKEYIQSIKDRLKMFASSNIADIIPNDWKDQPIDWLNTQIDDLLDEYNNTKFNLIQLELYLEYLKENNITEIKQIE